MTFTSTLSPTPRSTPSDGVVLVPALAPAPIQRGQKFCLYSETSLSSVRVEFFDIAGTMVATMSSSNPNDYCWSSADLQIGLYWVRIKTKDTSGLEWTGIQKLLVTP